MLKIVDVFLSKVNQEEYIGVLDTELALLTYYTHYEIQREYTTKFLELQGCNSIHASDTGKKFVYSSVQDIMVDSHLCNSYGIPDCIDYEKIVDFDVKKIPVGLRILKNNVVYTYQDSTRLGLCWHAHLFVPTYKSNQFLYLEQMLYKKPVLDCSYFFVDPLIKKDYLHNRWLDKLNKLTVNFERFCIDKLVDMSYFSYGLRQDIVGLKGTISQVLYGDNMFSVPDFLKDTKKYYQIIDLSEVFGSPFLLGSQGIFSIGEVVQLFFVKEPALIQMLQDGKAIRLRDVTLDFDKKEVYNDMMLQAAKYKMLGRPFKQLLYYSVVK